jgi:hypothetical protein
MMGTVDQSVSITLGYATETWRAPNKALTGTIMFHNYVTPYTSNRHKKLPNTEIWVYPSMVTAYKQVIINVTFTGQDAQAEG